MLHILFIMLIFTLFSCNNEDKIKNENINKDSVVVIKEYYQNINVEKFYDGDAHITLNYETIDNTNNYNDEIIEAFLQNKILSLSIEMYKNDNEKPFFVDSIPVKFVYTNNVVKGIKYNKGELFYHNYMKIEDINYEYELYFVTNHAEYDLLKTGREYKMFKLDEIKIKIPKQYSNPEIDPIGYDKYAMIMYYTFFKDIRANVIDIKTKIKVKYTL